MTKGHSQENRDVLQKNRDNKLFGTEFNEKVAEQLKLLKMSKIFLNC